jgi:hypothetical protein
MMSMPGVSGRLEVGDAWEEAVKNNEKRERERLGISHTYVATFAYTEGVDGNGKGNLAHHHTEEGTGRVSLEATKE